MEQEHASSIVKLGRVPWNNGKLVGAKPQLRPSHVWSIRTKLQIEGKKRDLALFNLAIDSKLRGCDIVAVRVDDVAPSGYSIDRATIRQKKTGRPVRFELTDQTRMAIDDYLRLTGPKPGQFLFAGRGGKDGLTKRQYARLVQEWVASIGLDPAKFGTTHFAEGRADLPAHWQPTCSPGFVGPLENRKHREVPRHRSRRCDRDRGENRHLI
jgi:hypothetical protein